MGRTIALTPFFNELDVLEVRLATLDNVVDLHVIAESRVTFAGERKPLLLQQHWERFEPWHDKIRYLHVEGMPKGDDVRAEPGRPTTACDSDRWRREKHQRDFLGEGLHDLEDDDLLFLSDLDEIPNPEAFHQGRVIAEGTGGIARPRLAMYVYALRWRWDEALPVIARFFSPATLAAHNGSIEQVRQQVGHAYGSEIPPSLGWHLAYMGGIEAIQYKLANAAHHELDVPQFNSASHVEHSITEGADLFDRPHRRATYAPGDELPPYLVANRERFAHLF